MQTKIEWCVCGHDLAQHDDVGCTDDNYNGHERLGACPCDLVPVRFREPSEDLNWWLDQARRYGAE